MLGELHLLGRWIPVEELALVGLDFLPLFKTRFVEQAFRGSLIGGTEAALDFVFVSAEYNCVNSPEDTFARFAQRPRRWVYVRIAQLEVKLVCRCRLPLDIWWN